MIDHITLSNELADLYIDQSARVHYEFFSSDYTKSRSLPVSARLQLKLMTVDALTSTDVSCNGELTEQLQYLFLEELLHIPTNGVQVQQQIQIQYLICWGLYCNC
jgi:hypothetical protein